MYTTSCRSSASCAVDNDLGGTGNTDVVAKVPATSSTKAPAPSPTTRAPAPAPKDADPDEGDEEILQGRYWRPLSAKAKDKFNHLENIGDLACILLHGHAVQLVRRSLQNMPVQDISELVALHILRTWRRHKDFWMLLRFDRGPGSFFKDPGVL